MRDPDYIALKAQRRYQSVWRDALLVDAGGPYSFPLHPPTAASVTTGPDQVTRWLNRWRDWHAQHCSATLRTRILRTTFGEQPVFTHLDLADTTALAALDPVTAKHWSHAQERFSRLRHLDVEAEIRAELSQLVQLDEDDFNTLLNAVSWFRDHPRSGLTVRSVPVPGMHTKWLAGHRALVMACLGLAASPQPVDDDLPQQDLDPVGLRATSAETGVVLADPALQALTGGLRQVTTPAHEIAGLPIAPQAVLIVENKQPAVAWPDTPGLVIIHSLGNHLEVIRRLHWLPNDRTWYWGDLDRHGFTLLSRARHHVPGLRSLMMGAADVEEFVHLGVTEHLTRYDSPMSTLSDDETRALARLQQTQGHLRIEQERLPLLAVHTRLRSERNGN